MSQWKWVYLSTADAKAEVGLAIDTAPVSRLEVDNLGPTAKYLDKFQTDLLTCSQFYIIIFL